MMWDFCVRLMGFSLVGGILWGYPWGEVPVLAQVEVDDTLGMERSSFNPDPTLSDGSMVDYLIQGGRRGVRLGSIVSVSLM
jgi:hypothetical protein